MKRNLTLALVLFTTVFLTGCAKHYCSVGENSTFGCHSYNPIEKPESSPIVLLRLQSITRGGLEVSTSVLSDWESVEIFGLDLAKAWIQPVWIHIKNNTAESYYLIKANTDPYYFTPNEVATMNHQTFAIDVNKAIDSYVKNKSITRQIPPMSEASGFYYSTWDPGVKYLDIALYSEDDLKHFVFRHEVPGLKLDYHNVDFDKPL